MIASKVILNPAQMEAIKVRTMNKKIRRVHITGELKERVSEAVYEYVRRNPGHKVASTPIAKAYGVGSSQVDTVVRHLLRDGKIEKASERTYRIHDPNKPIAEIKEVALLNTDGEVKPRPPVVSDGSPEMSDAVSNLLEAMTTPTLAESAKEFAWAENSDSLREFIKWMAGRSSR